VVVCVLGSHTLQTHATCCCEALHSHADSHQRCCTLNTANSDKLMSQSTPLLPYDSTALIIALVHMLILHFEKVS
jgi:hypothetical protein